LFLLLFILIFTPMSSNSISLKYGMDNSTQEQHQCKFLLSVGVQKTGSLKWVLVLM
jgi:biopolymer transport protein ExbD